MIEKRRGIWHRSAAALVITIVGGLSMGMSAEPIASSNELSTPGLDDPTGDAVELGCSGQDACVKSGVCSNLCGTCGILSQTPGNCVEQHGAGYVQCTCKRVGSDKPKPKPKQ